MAITPSLPSTQPGSPSSIRGATKPRFAGSPDGPSDTGVNEPQQDSFSRSQQLPDLDELLQQTQGDLGNLNAFLASLDRQEEAEKAHKGNQTALSVAALQGELPSLESPRPSHPTIESTEALSGAIDAREQELKKSWLPESVNKFFYPSTMDGFSPDFKDTLGTLQGLKASGASLDDHFAQQREQLKAQQKAAFQKQMESQRQMMRDMLKESGLKDDEIEARIDDFYKEQQPAVETELHKLGLNEMGIGNLYSTLGITDEDSPSQPKPKPTSSTNAPNE